MDPAAAFPRSEWVRNESHSGGSDPSSGPAGEPPTGIALAWAVHAFSASGAFLAFLALGAVLREDWALALVWLLVALAVDGVDGSLARLAHVKTRAGRVDGDTLDLVIDYLNYVFVPTLLIVRAELVPGALATPLAALILISALYNFARRDMKTGDNYFRGFPALWNVVAFYLLVTGPSEAVGAAAVVFFAVLTFAPVHFVHPFRVRDYGRWPPLLSAVWILATAALLWPDLSAAVRTALTGVSLGTAAILLGFGFLRTARGPA